MKKIITTLLGLGILSISTTASAYTVKSGDTLSEIAAEHNVSLHVLIERNPQIKDPNLIFPNQEIEVPNESVSVTNTQSISETISLTNYEHDLLSRLVRAEAHGEPYDGKVAVAKVVLNRVLDDYFPNTVHSVIYQKGQFQPVTNGSILRAATEESRKAVDEAVEQINNGQSYGALYFYNPATATNTFWLNGRPYVGTIGNHVFKK